MHFRLAKRLRLGQHVRMIISPWRLWLLLFFSFLLFHTPLGHAISPALLAALGNGSVLVEDRQGRVVVSHRADDPMIPASILKIATSYCALTHLPHDFRFQTDVYYADGTLTIRGRGDPSLVSEELDRMASELARRGLRQVSKIVLDDSYFAPHPQLDGQSDSLNPYDALNSALLVNFNTINIRKLKGGQIVSAEPQTPLTDLTIEMAKSLKVGNGRINLSRTPDKALLYVGHLLRAFLLQHGVAVSGPIVQGIAPAGAAPFYTYTSSKTLDRNLRELLEFSNNLMTNQLFLTMGAEAYGPPATPDKGQRVLADCLSRQLGWRNFHVEEGSGLSRRNQVTAAQMMVLLRAFEKYRQLLPMKHEPFLAKTGSLNGVSTLAGFTTTPSGKDFRFVLLLNGPHASYEAKFKVARLLYQDLSGM